MLARTQLLKRPDVHFIGSKVDVPYVLEPYRNQELLDSYLSLRVLSQSGAMGYRSAMASFSRLTGIPLAEAGELDLAAWFRKTRSQGLQASTIIIYAVYLEELLRHDLVRRGLKKREAEARAYSIMDGVPLRDLRRDMRRRYMFREMLITPEEGAAIWEAAEHPRVKAYMAVSDDSACRKGELLSARIKDLTHREEYSELRVYGKTGERTLPLIRSVPALLDWLEAHPDPRQGAPIFCTLYRGEARRMDIYTPNKFMTRLSERAGTRIIRPHMFRHTKLTAWARAGVGEYVLKSLAGWTPDSKMAAKYIHLSGRDHIPAVLRLEGVTGSLDGYARDALDAARGLMSSEDEETRIFALKTFMRLNGISHIQTTLGSGSVFQEAGK